MLAGQTTARSGTGPRPSGCVSTATPLVTAKTEDDFPAAAYGPDGTLWVAYISYTRKEDEDARRNIRQIKEQPADFKAYYTPEFGDQLFVKYYRGRASGASRSPSPDAQEDLVRCAIAVAGDGTAWVAYCRQPPGELRPLRPARSATSPARHGPRSAAGAAADDEPRAGPHAGHVYRPARASLAGLPVVERERARPASPSSACQGDKWQEGPALPERPRGRELLVRRPLAAGPDGQVAVAYDVYQRRRLRRRCVAVIDGDKVTEHVVAGSPKFEARPSLAYDAAGPALDRLRGRPRAVGQGLTAPSTPTTAIRSTAAASVRVVCLAGRQAASSPPPNCPTSGDDADISGDGANFASYEYARRYAYPQLGLDGKGRLWLTYRQKFGTPLSAPIPARTG